MGQPKFDPRRANQFVFLSLLKMGRAEDEAEQIATVVFHLRMDANILQSSFWISRKRKRDQAEPSRRLDLPHLLGGAETDVARDLRRDTFEELWKEQEDVTNVVVLSTRLMIGHPGNVSRENYRRTFRICKVCKA